MKKMLKYFNVAMMTAMVTLGCSSAALAADFVTASHATTVDVPENLSISADVGSFTLTMPSNASGTISNTQLVTYTLAANKMSQADGSAAINVNLDFLYDRLQFEASVGTYTKIGGNTEVADAAPGFQVIGTSNVGVANKANSTGAGDILDGTLPIAYRAVATDELPAGSQVHTLFVTLTTI